MHLHTPLPFSLTPLDCSFAPPASVCRSANAVTRSPDKSAAHRSALAQVFFSNQSKGTRSSKGEMDEATAYEIEALRRMVLAQRILTNGEDRCLSLNLKRDFAGFGLIPLSGIISRSASGTFQSVSGQEAELRIGAYTRTERQRKIRKYKDKLRRRRSLCPVARRFEGRRQIAFAKFRCNGRFAKPPTCRFD